MEATIVFKNGSELEVEVNGNNYIIQEEPAFPDDLSEVIVRDESGDKVYHNVTVQQAFSVDGRFWFILHEETEQERLKRTIETLMEENSMLTECILEMSEIIYG